MDKVYIRPLTFAGAPQDIDGPNDEPGVVRLAGSMVYAREFAIVVRDKSGAIASREIVAAPAIAEALARLPDDLAADAERQWTNLRRPHPPLSLTMPDGQPRMIRLDQPQVMAILNVTPDSFSDGGKFLDDPDNAVEHGVTLLEGGAAIVDVGGESTRPGADAVWEGDEISRVVPAIERLARGGAAVSVDTRKRAVMAAAIDAGARIVNDVSALRHDPDSAALVAEAGVPVILMHAPGDGHDLHAAGDYRNVVLDVFDFLAERRDAAVAAGIARENILLDPGIGFGKSLADNLALLNALPLFHALGHPLVLGASRKRMIGALSNEAPAHERLAGSLAIAVKAMDAGVPLLRVHDPAETAQAMRVWRGLRDAALTDFSNQES